MAELSWKKDLASAEKEIHGTGRLLFMFFHHPKCGGCKKTMGITFKDPRVRETLERDFAPLTYLVTEAQDLTAKYHVEWTPTFIIADEHGKELERWVGFLPPEDFLSQVHLSEGLSAFHREQFRSAENEFDWIIGNQPESAAAPEARYYLGVARYKETGDPVHLVRTWESLKKGYPGNMWTKKASAWS